MQCQFSGKGRKNSQATRLSVFLLYFPSQRPNVELIAVGARFNNFGNVEDRLERIEGTLSGLADSLLRMENSKSSPSSSSDKSDDARSIQESRDSSQDDLQDLEKLRVLHGQVLRDVNGNERYFRSISLASLMWEAHCIIDARGISVKGSPRSQSLSESSRQLLECCSDISVRDQIDLSHDGLPLVLPPKFILDATVGSFFGEIHGLMPIFNRQNFDANLETIYAGRSTGSDLAWTMCFNNIVLLTLMPKTIQNQKQHTHMDAGLVKSFMDNFRRGYQHLDEFLRPTICNVQVLITMVRLNMHSDEESSVTRCQTTCTDWSVGLSCAGELPG